MKIINLKSATLVELEKLAKTEIVIYELPDHKFNATLARLCIKTGPSSSYPPSIGESPRDALNKFIRNFSGKDIYLDDEFLGNFNLRIEYGDNIETELRLYESEDDDSPIY